MIRLEITTEQLKAGLWRSYDEYRDVPHAERLFNVVCKEGGIIPVTPLELAVDLDGNALTFAWPDPQLLVLEETMLLPYGNSLYEVSPVYSPSLVELVNYQNFNEADTLQPGGVWQIADFGRFWMITNGTNIVFHPNFDVVLRDGKFPVCNDMGIGSMTSGNGRLLLGNFDPELFWKPGFSNLLQHLGHVDEKGFNLGLDVDQNYVFWSSPGGELLWLFYPEMAVNGAFGSNTLYGELEPYLLDLFKRQDMAFARMPFSGAVVAIRPMQINGANSFIVYGTNGVAVLYPIVEPYPGFKIYKLTNGIGAYSSGCVGGDTFKQIFIDKRGTLHMIIEGKIQRLGYEHLLASMLSELTIITHDQINDWFYISNGTITYLLGNTGLSTVDQAITSIVPFESTMRGIYEDITGSTKVEVEYYLSGFNYGGFKEIHSVEATFGTSEPTNYMEVSWKYRMSAVGSWNQTNWRRTNNVGHVVYPITAYEIILCLRWQSYEDLELPKTIVIWYNDLDTRNIRGFYGRTKIDDVR